MENSNYPTVNYIGNKEKIARWVVGHFPSDARSVFDAFSGGASVGYLAKERGFEVYSNDILKSNFHIAKALIENRGETLSDADVRHVFEGRPFAGFMTENYSGRFYFEEECMQLDRIRENILSLDSCYKISLAFSLIRRAMVRKMPYSRFNIKWDKILQLRDEEYSYRIYGRKRAYHNQSFEFHFKANLEDYNNAVFDNGMRNRAYCEDIFALVQSIHSDIIYIDPPYTGTLNNYHSFYGLLDEYIDSSPRKPFEHDFTDRKSIVRMLDILFSLSCNYRYCILSYNSKAYPTKDILTDLLSRHFKTVDILEIPYAYKVTGKDKKNSSMEYLFIAHR